MHLDLARPESRVGLALPVDLTRAGAYRQNSHRVARGRIRIDEVRIPSARCQCLRRQRRHFDSEIDAIEQRAGHASTIAGDAVRRAMAASALMPEPAARTWIHRGDKLELSRERALPRRARDMDDARLERLAQSLQYAAVPLGQLVEKQDAVMSERDLTRTRVAASAGQRDRARGVMRRAEWTHAPSGRTETAGKRRNGRARKRFVLGERREQSRQALRQHRLARSRWSEDRK